MTTEIPSLPVTYHPRKRKAIGFLIGAIAFVAGGVFLILRGELLIGWFCVSFFGLCLPAFLCMLLPGMSYLILDGDGFTFAVMFRTTTVRWEDIAEFGVITMRQTGVPVSKMVAFNFVADYEGNQKGRSVSRAMTGFEGGLPDTYGHRAEDLAELMSALHARALSKAR